MAKNYERANTSDHTPIAAALKLVLDTGIGAALAFCRVLWVFHATLAGVISLILGVAGVLKGHLIALVPIGLGGVFLASIVPQIANKLGWLEKGLVFLIIAIIQTRLVAEMDHVEHLVLMRFLMCLACGSLVYQIAKQAKQRGAVTATHR